ncbi:hypothetical protein [Persicobacter psychrovividus]|uniref:Uncharacterized protein n=1 Tax=Persicobacter psychrovividus TaxID=387638 RepID=A0ABN6LDF9_9BACT|nr:hypothetical protein PEPS_31890 [Persicobacter psychrovividus]
MKKQPYFYLPLLVIFMLIGCKSNDVEEGPVIGGELGSFQISAPQLSRGSVNIEVIQSSQEATATPQKATLIVSGVDQMTLEQEPPYNFTLDTKNISDGEKEVAVRLDGGEGVNSKIVKSATLIDNVILTVSVPAGYNEAFKMANSLDDYSQHWYLTDSLGNLLTEEAQWEEGADIAIMTDPSDANFLYKLAIVEKLIGEDENGQTVEVQRLNYQDILSFNDAQLTFELPTSGDIETDTLSRVVVENVPDGVDPQLASVFPLVVSRDGSTVTYNLIAAKGQEIPAQSFIPLVVYFDDADGKLIDDKTAYVGMVQDGMEEFDYTSSDLSTPDGQLKASVKMVEASNITMYTQGTEVMLFGKEFNMPVDAFNLPFGKTLSAGVNSITGDFFAGQYLSDVDGKEVLYELYGSNIVQSSDFFDINVDLNASSTNWNKLTYDQQNFNSTIAMSVNDSGDKQGVITAQFVYNYSVDFSLKFPANVSAVYPIIDGMKSDPVQTIDGVVLGSEVDYPEVGGGAQTLATVSYPFNTPSNTRTTSFSKRWAVNEIRHFPNLLQQYQFYQPIVLKNNLLGEKSPF